MIALPDDSVAVRIRRVLCGDGRMLVVSRSVPVESGRAAGDEWAPVSAVMARDVLCVRQEVSVEALASLLLERSLHGVPVVDTEDALCGFVSMTDLIRDAYVSGQEVTLGDGAALEAGFHVQELARATVADIMTPAVLALPETTPVLQAALLLSGERLHRVPIINDAAELCGMLSAVDLLRFMSDGEPIPGRRRRN